MPDDFRYDVFLSHSTKDKPIVLEIAERLKKDGIKVWFDAWEIKPGASISAKVDEGLESSRVLVFFMSANAFGSDWALLESYTARFKDPLNKKLGFIPLRLDNSPIKRSLEQFRYIDWTAADTTQAYQELVESCRAEASSSSPTRYTRDFIPQPPAFYADPDYIGSHQFVGRQAELDALSDWANRSDPTNLLLFESIGGNGKSMLTWEWTTKHATTVRPDWAGRFWYSFYERGAIMQDFCQRALAYMTGRPLKDFGERKIVEMQDELIAQLHARPWLLILDGLERVLVAYHRIDAAEVPDEEANAPTDKILNRNPCDAIRDEDSDLLRAFAACSPSKILISSRLTPRILLNPAGQPIPGAKRITLPGLRPSDAEALLRQCGITGDSAAIQNYLQQNCDNHPLVIGILAGLIANYLPDRGNFDAWSVDPSGGASLDLGKLDLIQRRNHILQAAIEALPNASRQLLSTFALLSDSVDYDTLKAFNPHLPAEPAPPMLEKGQLFSGLLIGGGMVVPLKSADPSKAQHEYEAALARRKEFENTLQTWRESMDDPAAQKKLQEVVRDLEQRGLLQYDGHERRYDLHPVVRGVAAGDMQSGDKQRYGQRVVDHFSSQLHKPDGQAKSMEDVANGLHLVRTFLKLGNVEFAAIAFRDHLCDVLHVNLEAHVEILSLLRPFFSAGWGEVPLGLSSPAAGWIKTFAALTLRSCGEFEAALAAYSSALRVGLATNDWTNSDLRLLAISRCLTGSGFVVKALRAANLALEFSMVLDDTQTTFLSRLKLFTDQAQLGYWSDAEATWQLLNPMGRSWTRNVYRQGEAEYGFALWQYWQGTLREVHLVDAASLAQQDNNRKTTRYIHRLRGSWRLEQCDYTRAADNLREAVRMARECGLTDSESETGLAMAKHHLGQLTGEEFRSEAQRLAQLRQPAHRYLAQLWLAIGDEEQAKHHALAAYRWAWADGEPYVHRCELTKTTELLEQMCVPVPVLPPYDPAKDVPFPWEADVQDAIEKLKAEKATKQGE